MRLLLGFLLGAAAVLATGVAGGWVSLEDDLCPRLPAACDALLPATATPQDTPEQAVAQPEPMPDSPLATAIWAEPAQMPEEQPKQQPEQVPEQQPRQQPVPEPQPPVQPLVQATPPTPTADLAPAPAAPGSTRLPLEFRSEVSARGFARHLGSVTGAAFSIEQRGPGRYAVSYAWADPREREEIARAIALRIGDGGRG